MAARKRILCVDDSDVALLAERMMLERSGRYAVIVARNGEEAVQRAEQDRPDAILLDVVMPGANGFEVCRALRSNASTRAIPIIMVTTRSETSNVNAGFESGCDEYVFKPVNGAELLQKLEKLVP